MLLQAPDMFLDNENCEEPPRKHFKLGGTTNTVKK
jgi:hypothetical protein